MHALKRGVSRSFNSLLHSSNVKRSHLFGIILSHRFLFGFSPTPSVPEGIENFELLYREHEPESNEAKKILRQNGYIDMISLRDIDKYPLNANELRDIRSKMKLHFHIWTDPAIYEDPASSSQNIESIIKQIVDGYSKTRKSNKNIYDRIHNKESDKYRIITPIFYDKSNANTQSQEIRAILARPADRLITIIKPSKQQIKYAYYGDEDKRYQVLGTQWHKKGARFYDNDDGLSWDHVKFEDYYKKNDENLKNWSDLDYALEHVDDPNEFGDTSYLDEIKLRRGKPKGK